MAETQLNLPYEGSSFSQAWWDAVLNELRKVIDDIGMKEAAYLLDVRPSSLSHALSERDRHYVRAEWMLILLSRAKDLGLARAIMNPAGLEVERRPELSAQEKLERLERTLAEELGPDTRRTLYEKAWRRD